MANYLFRQLFSVQTWLRKGLDTLLNVIKTEAGNAVCFLDQFQNRRVTKQERLLKFCLRSIRVSCVKGQRFLCFFESTKLEFVGRK